jgi:hypothetical protein
MARGAWVVDAPGVTALAVGVTALAVGVDGRYLFAATNKGLDRIALPG